MTTWNPDDSSAEFRLVQSGFVTKFHSAALFSEVGQVLGQSGYRVVRLDASRWAIETRMHEDLAVALGFPDYYGGNLDALSDCLRDVAECAYGWAPSDLGLVLMLDGFDTFADHDQALSTQVVDIFAQSSRMAALFGNRMLCLLRSDDPHLELPSIGGSVPTWNEKEWLTRDRVAGT